LNIAFTSLWSAVSNWMASDSLGFALLVVVRALGISVSRYECVAAATNGPDSGRAAKCLGIALWRFQA
jgi:hypothetical protein